MKNKNAFLILLALLFIVVAVLGIVIIQQKQKISRLNDQLIIAAKKKAEPTVTPTPLQPKPFMSQEYGFKLTVLPGWVATEKKNETCGIPTGIVKPGTCTDLTLEKGNATLSFTYKKATESGQIYPSGFGAYTSVSKEEITFNGKPMTVDYQTDMTTDTKASKEITNVAINSNNIVKLKSGVTMFISYTEKPSTRFASVAVKPETLKDAILILQSFSEE